MRERISILKSDKGTSLVLVSILSTIVLALCVTLLIVSSLIISTSVRKTREDQAYELATSLSSRLEYLILNESDDHLYKSQIELTPGTLVSESGFDGIPDSSVTAVITKKTDYIGQEFYVLTVTAETAGERYIKETQYWGNATEGYSVK